MYLTFQLNNLSKFLVPKNSWTRICLKKIILGTYTSPSLFIFQIKKKEQINFVKANLLGRGLHPRSFPISW